MSKVGQTRGAVSVFLVMILVPCIVVSSIFVDLGRVHMSKSMAASAGDLALNTLMTNYDADLKDWYGMVASCQSIGDFYEVSAQYFLRAISSQGLSDEEIITLSAYYADATNDDTIYDLLQIECQTASADMIKAVDGANLSEATFIKDEIIEFMKYRAPIEIAEGIIDRIKSDSTTTQALEADVNKPLVDDKQTFYESEGKLTEASYYTYLAVHDYYKKTMQTPQLTNDRLAEGYVALTGYKDAYYAILAYVVSNLTNTSGLAKYYRYTNSLTAYDDEYSNPDKKFSEVYSKKETEDDVTTYYINISDVKTLVTNLSNKVTAFETARNNFNTAASPILQKLPYGNGDSQANPIQWWVAMNNAINSSSGHTSKIQSAAEDMLKAYSKVKAIDSCTLQGDVPDGWSSLGDWKTALDADDLLTEVGSLQSTYLTAGVSDSGDTYLNAVSSLEKVSADNILYIDSANLSVTVDGESKSLSSALSHISSQLTQIVNDLQAFIDLLKIAIEGDGKNVVPLDNLKQYAKDYDTKLDKWQQTAQKTDTTMATGNGKTPGTEDYVEGDRVESANKAAANIDEAAVTELKTRLVNIRSQIQGLIDAVNSMKLNGKEIKNITDLDTFKSKAAVDKSKIGLTNGELKTYTDDLFKQRFKPETIPSFQHKDDTNYNVIINPETGNVNTPYLYKYFHETYKNCPKDGMDQAKQEKDEANKEADKVADDAKDKDRCPSGAKDIPYAYSKPEAFDAGDALLGAVGVIKDLCGVNLTNMRDDLYATTYVMEMFSYATHENEGKYSLLEQKAPEKITQLTLANYNQAGYYPDVEGTDEYKWSSEKETDYYNKTLTNKMINAANNPAYGAEIEYILYGGKDKKSVDNVKKSYSTIYVVRYGLNLVSGFQHFWNPLGLKKTEPTAVALFAAGAFVQSITAGIIPPAVTEAVLIPILTIFETSKDLDRLEAGFPVEMYKTKPEMWWCSLGTGKDYKGISKIVTALKDVLANNSKNKNTGEGLFYSDYLTLFVYLGLNSSTQEGMYQRIAEVIQFNIGSKLGHYAEGYKDKRYSLENSIMYFKMDAKVRVKPLMITLPIFNDYDNNMDTKTDWCTYSVTATRGYS